MPYDGAHQHRRVMRDRILDKLHRPLPRAGVGTLALRARLPGGVRASSLAPLSMLTYLIVHGPFWGQRLLQVASVATLRGNYSEDLFMIITLHLGTMARHPRTRVCRPLRGGSKVRVGWRLESERTAYLS